MFTALGRRLAFVGDQHPNAHACGLRLNELRGIVHPAHETLFANCPEAARQYYWSVANPDFTSSGLRNQDVRVALFGVDTRDPKEPRRRSSAASRKQSLLRAHGLLEKVSKSHTYRVLDRSRLTLSALLTTSNSTLKHLNQQVA